MTDAVRLLDERYREAGWMSPSQAAALRHQLSKSYCAMCLYTISKTGVRIIDPEAEAPLTGYYPAATIDAVQKLLIDHPTFEVHSMSGKIGLYATTRFNGTFLCAYCVPAYLERRM